MMTSTLRILITGASGFLGQHFLHDLLTTPLPEEDFLQYEIYALYHSMEGFKEKVQNYPISNTNRVTVRVDSLDLTNEEDIEKWIQNTLLLSNQQQQQQQEKETTTTTICYHIAALSNPRLCEEQPEVAYKVNVPTFFFNALTQAHIPIVAVSTDQVYAGDKQAPYEEVSDSPRPCNVYGKSKLTMEEYFLKQQSVSSKQPTHAVILRSSIILGPKAPFLPEKAHSTFLHFIQSRKDIETTFYTDECRSVIAVQDVISVFKWLLNPKNYPINKKDNSNNITIFNMGGPDSVSRFDMAKAVFEYLKYDQTYLKADTKASQPPGPVQTPLDITMNSEKIQTQTGLIFKGIKDAVKFTFPSSS